ncbi:MAG: putative N-acetylmannosamine-6-phosphate 2-epimerase [Armatimonadota bacterium]|nr:putative N-acetylmannosamine-6-phosphate 2-epimerase [Armatimonadota bacterium]MDR7485450.1 putative N-acetylmannosamine-6-phosphate 2-epimerase [Armatimonadota bacterium]MDR7534367.1 putative N-acetylmannosamine-6-phosphate 2-epimerase [Armatimonadota bacterium]MDR7536832.1 putative N-acetylmannosamine-6-phosphate 2-epimerase [Armatimonadota bacterium]
MHPSLARLAGGLVVSCQARPDNPLHGPAFMAAMARAAAAGGAVGVRVDGPDDVRAVRTAVAVPIVGLSKRPAGVSPVVITPTFADAAAVAEAGADIIAVDGTSRPRPGGVTLETLIRRIHAELDRPVLADVGDLADGLAAAAAGADAVATTLSGYLDATQPPPEEPDLDLVEALARRLQVPVIAEGRIRTPEEARMAMARGAFAVVVGTAITNPREITRRFVAALHG